MSQPGLVAIHGSESLVLPALIELEAADAVFKKALRLLRRRSMPGTNFWRPVAMMSFA
jgi:hypothetical protein